MHLSVIIITLNEEKNLPRTLESLRELKQSNLEMEVLVLDSGSTDRTESIAKESGAKFAIQNWLGYSKQKNHALTITSGDWLLFLDADEELSRELSREIEIVVSSSDPSKAFALKRKTFYLGRLLNYAWYPDVKTRLVNRGSNPEWVGEIVHEDLILKNSGVSILTLESPLIHYSYRNINHHFEKTLNYAKLSAEDYSQKNKKFHYWNLFLNPLVAFIRLYFLRQGFRDGFPGLIAGFSTYFYTFLKYALLKELNSNRHN
ncbi:MAG: glycosyltransferase family 2 protein [bacterium]|jgi:glycosyltransferase involved in cell wall biosynthesis